MSYTRVNSIRCSHCGYKADDASELVDEHLNNGSCVELGP